MRHRLRLGVPQDKDRQALMGEVRAEVKGEVCTMDCPNVVLIRHPLRPRFRQVLVLIIQGLEGACQVLC